MIPVIRIESPRGEGILHHHYPHLDYFLTRVVIPVVPAHLTRVVIPAVPAHLTRVVIPAVPAHLTRVVIPAVPAHRWSFQHRWCFQHTWSFQHRWFSTGWSCICTRAAEHKHPSITRVQVMTFTPPTFTPFLFPTYRDYCLLMENEKG